MPGLQDKTVLVTGAGAGIGRATALAMAAEGAIVAVADIDLAAAERTAAQAAGNRRWAIAIEADCGDVASIDAMVVRAAAELGRYNINVNAICPGITRTERGARNAVTRAAERGITVEELLAQQEAGIPIRRANTPDDIAAMAVFLASPGARNITGQSYNVDGGLVPS